MSSSAVPFDALDAYAEIVRLYCVSGRTHDSALACARAVTEGLLSGFSVLEDEPATAPPVFPSAPGPVLSGVVPLPDSEAIAALSEAFGVSGRNATEAIEHLNSRGVVLVRDPAS